MEKTGTSLSSSNNKINSFEWVFYKLRKPPCKFLWNVASSITLATVGIFSKFIIRFLNTTHYHNYGNFSVTFAKKPKDVPLITISNHLSCFDDPGIWGSLNIGILCNRQKMRWSLAAHDICFTKTWHSYFFMLGKCVPVIRGTGVYQEAINFCLERLKEGEWVHIFPEGRVNENKEYIRFKWGIGRLIYDCPVTPIVIPIWHIGMEDILPNKTPYIFRIGKEMTLNFGNPIDLSHLVSKLRKEEVSPETARRTITVKIQEELMKLGKQTEILCKSKG